MNWYLEVLKKYVDFSGRARRKEFWMFGLVSFLISMALLLLDNLLGTVSASGYALLNTLYGLAVFLPSISVTVRRLHDTGHGGAWYFIVLVPLIGPIILLLFMVRDSEPGDNRFGPNPKGVGGTRGFAVEPVVAE